MKNIFTFILALISFCVYTQTDGINQLGEVILKGNFSPSLNVGYSVTLITDSIPRTDYQSLGNLLQNQANLYFKQNGNGMVSSISLRGTGASQTGVYWNGIAINSSLNGQTDFNSLSANGFDTVEIRRGGASVLLGSGAIGGAINLRDEIIFQEKKEAIVNLGFGSYRSINGNLLGLFSNENLFAKIAVGATKSDNDYPYFDSDLKNENGEYENYNISAVLAYRINAKNRLHLHTSFLSNDRNNSRTITAENNANLINSNTRTLLDWKHLGSKYSSSFKLAYLTEKYVYLFDKDYSNKAFGKSDNIVSKYDFNYYLNNTIFFKAGVEFKHEKGWGSSILEKKQSIFESHILFHHNPIYKLDYNLSIRKGFSSVFDIPLIYAIDAKYDLTQQMVFKLAFSTNYRNPTFNDLYWDPGGNTQLKTEKSTSTEIGLNYKYHIFQFNITSYYIKSNDLIQWRPVDGNFWQPQNIRDASNYGLEVFTSVKKIVFNRLFEVKLQYDYTISKDEELDKQLIYVPFHKANTIFSYQFKKWDLVYNLQYTGKVFTTTSNTEYINAYLLSNIDIHRRFYKDKIQVVFEINNLFNENYQSVAYRPMPNRNYSIHINIKI